MHTRGAEIFGAFPEAGESKLYTAMPIRRAPKRVDLDQEILRDYTQINKLIGQTIGTVESQNEIFTFRLDDLEQEIKTSRGDIAELRDRIQKVNDQSSTKGETQSVSDMDIANLTVDSTVEFLKTRPLVLENFLEKTEPVELIGILTMLDFSVREAFVGYSVAQLDRLVSCVDGYERLTGLVGTAEFGHVSTELIEDVFGSSLGYVFLRNPKYEEYSTRFPEKGIDISLKRGDCSITGVLQGGACRIYTDPTAAPGYSASIDQLFNPQKVPVLLVPIGIDGILAVMHTDKTSFTFSNEDQLVARFLSEVLSKIVTRHVRMLHEKRERKMKLVLGSFEHELFAMDQLETLLPFLRRKLQKLVKADEVKLFLFRDGFFVSYDVKHRRLVEFKHDVSGVPAAIRETHAPVVLESLNEDYPAFDKKMDSWALLKPFAGLPIYDSSEKASAVLCTSGVRPFGETDIEFLTSLATALSLLLPQCIQGVRYKNASEAQAVAANFPREIADIHVPDLESHESICKLAKVAAAEMKAGILSIYERSGESIELLISVKGGESTTERYVTDDYVHHVFEVNNPILDTDATRIPHFGTTDSKLRVTSVISVCSGSNESKQLAIIGLNCKGNSGQFPDGYVVVLEALANLILYSKEMRAKNDAVEDGKTLTTVSAEALSLFKLALDPLTPVDISSVLKAMTANLQMSDFLFVRYQPLAKNYAILFKSFEFNGNAISEDDQLMQQLATHNEPVALDRIKINSHVIERLASNEALIEIPISSTDRVFALFFGSSCPANCQQRLRYYTTILATFYRNYLLSSDESVSSKLAISKQIDVFHTKLTDENVASRLFSITMFSEKEKIEAVMMMFTKLELFDILETNYEEFTAFLLQVRDSYHKVPYHNWDHAVDTTQFVFSCIVRGSLGNVFKPVHVSAILLASLLHDVGHEGVNSTFHINTKSPLVAAYGEESPLEKHHLALATRIVRERLVTPEKNLYRNVTFWKFFASSILATDMIKHFDYMEEFQALELGENPNEKSLVLLSQLLIKCGNVGNTTRPFDVVKPMAQQLLEEYLAQGAQEESLGLPETGLSEAVHKHHQSLRTIEVEFMTTIVLPILKTLGRVIPDLADFAVQMEDNRRQWEMSS